ncbi:MAG TPA: DotU family type IV/VI secretion system protein [Candidatus Angelobacter sp.]|nr:DotU family type IV/VI secretion system protein [Candidatus Angelobacter sp.]
MAVVSARMAYPGYQNSLLLTQFREFYQELARQKSLVINPVSSLSQLVQDETRDPLVQTEDVWQRLLSLLESQAERASRSGGAFGYEVYREAQYIMAALADEFFLNENWQGKQNWPLLEIRLFRSSSAGELVFKKLDLLLLQRDPVYLDLATVYFFVLSLGFQGKYRGSDPNNQLDRYKRQLFAMIFRQNPELLENNHHLFQQTYSHTLTEGKVSKLRHPRNWFLLFAAIIVMWLSVSHMLWQHLTAPINQEINEICKTSGCQGETK